VRFSLQECCYDARGGVQVPYPAFTPSIVVVFRGCEISVEVVRLRHAEASPPFLRPVRGNVPKCCGVLSFRSPFFLERFEELIARIRGAHRKITAAGSNELSKDLRSSSREWTSKEELLESFFFLERFEELIARIRGAHRDPSRRPARVCRQSDEH